ncbi:MAG: ParB/RepB/Spo0J family partition protein [Nevskiales bacterium]
MNAALPTIRRLALDLIHPGRYQARRRFDPDALKELAASIAESGIVQPLVVRSAGRGYELLAGERRWRAAQLAGLEEIPAIVRDDLDEREAHILGLIENLQRESLSPMETARGLQQLSELFALTHEAAADRVGKSRVYVTNFLRLLKLDERVQKLVDDGLLAMGHARVLAGLEFRQQMPLAAETLKRRWSVRALEAAGRRLQNSGGKAGTLKAKEWKQLELELTEELGNEVHIAYDAKAKHGEIRIEFHSLDEFEGLLERLRRVRGS